MAAKLFESNPKADSQLYRQATIPPKAGADAFARVLSSRNKRVIVVPFDLSRRMEFSTEGTWQAHCYGGSSDFFHQRNASTGGARGVRGIATAYEPPSTDTERFLPKSGLHYWDIDWITTFLKLGGRLIVATRMSRTGTHCMSGLLCVTFLTHRLSTVLFQKFYKLHPREMRRRYPDDREEIVL